MQKGKLIYVIGPSGCGKDSVMGYVRKRCSASKALFAHRYITRPADAGGENHVFLPPDEFQARRSRGLFALDWDSHGMSYGIGCEIFEWMQAGFNVVANGSRAYLPLAASRCPDMIPVLITVEEAILRERLISRGRESMDEIESRLKRAVAYEVRHPALVELDNSQELHLAGDALLGLVGSTWSPMKKVI